MDNINKTFAYGTLKVGGYFSSRFDTRRVSAKKAKLNGYELFRAGKFPAAVKGSDYILGEIHEYNEYDMRDIITEMDYIEGFEKDKENDSLYIRVPIEVELENGTIEKAYTYIFNPSMIKLAKPFEKVNAKHWEI